MNILDILNKKGCVTEEDIATQANRIGYKFNIHKVNFDYMGDIVEIVELYIFTPDNCYMYTIIPELLQINGINCINHCINEVFLKENFNYNEKQNANY